MYELPGRSKDEQAICNVGVNAKILHYIHSDKFLHIIKLFNIFLAQQCQAEDFSREMKQGKKKYNYSDNINSKRKQKTLLQKDPKLPEFYSLSPYIDCFTKLVLPWIWGSRQMGPKLSSWVVPVDRYSKTKIKARGRGAAQIRDRPHIPSFLRSRRPSRLHRHREPPWMSEGMHPIVGNVNLPRGLFTRLHLG